MWSDTAILPFKFSLIHSTNGLEDTDVILNFSAVAPTKWKRALILWFKNRTRTIAPSRKIYEKEITNLKEKFFKNGYPIKFVNGVIDRSIYLNKDCTK